MNPSPTHSPTTTQHTYTTIQMALQYIWCLELQSNNMMSASNLATVRIKCNPKNSNLDLEGVSCVEGRSYCLIIL